MMWVVLDDYIYIMRYIRIRGIKLLMPEERGFQFIDFGS